MIEWLHIQILKFEEISDGSRNSSIQLVGIQSTEKEISTKEVMILKKAMNRVLI